eukprot:4657350-Pyramimonas_sp.AAC.1
MASKGADMPVSSSAMASTAARRCVPAPSARFVKGWWWAGSAEAYWASARSRMPGWPDRPS